MAASSDEWELSKENIQPLQQGRKPEVLKVALTSEDIILQKRQAFENELRTYAGNDPLSVWCDYIRWVEQNFPKGGRDGHIGQLIQQCLSILKDKSEYYDDKRFVEIWLKFANLASKPTEVYNYMYSRKIGCKSTAFFIAWSWELENQGNISGANRVLSNGISHKSEPIERLKSYRSDFEMRIASKVMGDSRQECNDGEPHRSAFSVLKPQKKNLAPVVRTGDSVVAPGRANVIIGRQQPFRKQNVPSAKVPFKIYNAENIAPPLPVQSDNSIPFILHSDSSKENEKRPSKWNKVKVKQMPSGSRISEAVDPGFKLHCDEAAPPASTPRSVPKVSNILRTRQECPPPPLALFEPPDPLKKPMYDKDKVYGGAEEFSFEEIRAAAWVKRKNLIEKEKQIAEQDRILREQKEQIKKLLHEVEILKSNQLFDVPKPTNLIENKSIDKLSAKHASANSQSSYLNHNKSNVEISQDPSIATIQRELFPNSNLASTFREASGMVRDLYNDTFYHQTDNLASTENLLSKSNHQPINFASSDQKVNLHDSVSSLNYDASAEPDSQVEQHLSRESAVPFKLYCDPVEHTSQSKAKESGPLLLKQPTTELSVPNKTFKENENGDVENIPPQGYVQEINRRELSGILQPSKNILYVPLELQECEEENSDEDGEYLYTENNNNPVQNETLIPPCNTEQFVSAAFLSSTPRTQYKVEKKLNLQDEDHHLSNFTSSKSFDPSNQNCNPAHLQSTLEDMACIKQMGKTDTRMSLKECSTFPGFTGQLSVIMETSRECYKSSSSSGSSASVTKLSHLEQCFSHEKSNTQKHLSKIDTFKEPRPVIQSRDLSHSHNDRENTFDAFKEPRPVSKKTSFHSTNSKSENILKDPKSQDEREDYFKNTNTKHADTSNNIDQKEMMLEDKRKFELYCTDIDPFDADLNTEVLQGISLPDDYYSNFHASQKVIRNLEVNDEIKFGDFICVVENLVSEGAYGKVYEAKKRHLSIQKNGSCCNSKVALKVCKRINDWEYYICYILHKRLTEMNSPPDIRLSVMEIISAHRYCNDLVLVSEFSHQGTLLDLVNYYKQQNFGVPECITMYLTFELLHIMANVHECKIVHGDVKPDNILLRDNISVFDASGSFSQKTTFLKLIDFGRAIDLSVFKPGVCFKTVLKDGCIEMRENEPWVFQIDWYGLLNCIHVLLFSEYMKVKKNSNGRWMIEKKFKRYWDQALWVPLFDELLNIPSCYEEPNVLKYTKLIESKLKTNEQTFKMHFQRLTNFNMKK